MNRIYKTYKAAYSGLPKEAWLLALVVFLNRCGSMVLFFLTLYLTKHFNYTIADAGKIISIYGIGSLIGSYFGGWLSDRFGTKIVQCASLLFSGIGFIVLGYIKNLSGIGIMMFIIAVIAESFRPANASAFAQVCLPEQRARGFALNRAAINLGLTVGPAFGGFLAMIDYSYIFWVNGIASILSSFVFWLLLYRSRGKYIPNIIHDNITIKSPWKDSIFLIFIGLMLFLGIMFFQIFNTWPLYLTNVYGLLENQIGSLLFINGALIVLIEMPLIHKFEKKNQLRIITHGSFIFIAGFALLPFYSGYNYAIFTVLIWSIGEMLVFPLSAAFIANRASSSNIGKYMGMYVFTFSLSLVIGPSVGSWVYEIYGADILWYSFGIVGVLVWIGFKFLHINIQRKEQTSSFDAK